MTEHTKEELNLKILVVGESGCGKSSYVKRATTGKYAHGTYMATIGVDFLFKIYPNRWNGRDVSVHLWDIGGKFNLSVELQLTGTRPRALPSYDKNFLQRGKRCYYTL